MKLRNTQTILKPWHDYEIGPRGLKDKNSRDYAAQTVDLLGLKFKAFADARAQYKAALTEACEGPNPCWARLGYTSLADFLVDLTGEPPAPW
jgi:hypothetical protein